jgi:hypothetical protein
LAGNVLSLFATNRAGGTQQEEIINNGMKVSVMHTRKRQERVYETITSWKEDGKTKRKIDRTTYPARGETPGSQFLWFAMGVFAMAVIRALLLME